MFEHVLVPLDGSQLAQTALDYALRMVGETGTITLVNVLTPLEIPAYDFYPIPINQRIEDYEAVHNRNITRARDYLKHVADGIHELSGCHLVTKVVAGDAAESIIQLATDAHVDAIVMTTHGRSGISRWIYGSVTQKVLTAHCCPVLVVPPKETHAAVQAQNEGAHDPTVPG
ncbi:MAG TPA: universal stress protein [Phototrophicaceae bacterium]|nr:universal stress protein [Phototrophicaceae bacterium]